MEHNEKHRSASFGANQSIQVSSGEAKKLSLSEGSIVDRATMPSISNASPGSSDGGTLKKQRKFRPTKFIAKRLGIKKKDAEESELSTASEGGQTELETMKKESKLLNSPKLQRIKKNLAKRFSGKKSYKVAPMEASKFDDEISSKVDIEKSSESEASLKDIDDIKPSEVDNGSFADDLTADLSEIEESTTLPSKEIVTLKSSKVQLKITISGKKIEKAAEQLQTLKHATDKASPLQEIQQRRTDIILPSTNTTLRLSTARDEFFNVMVPKEKDEGIASHSVTYSTVVREGSPIGNLTRSNAQGSKEIEKYLVLTSSLNSIISAARELDELTANVQDLKFPDLPELKITEESEVQSTIVYDSELDEMKKQMKKSKIPIDRRRSSSDKESTTVQAQEASQPYHLNLSSTSSSSVLKNNQNISNELTADGINFEVGNPVRPLRTSPAISLINIPLIASSEIPFTDDINQESPDESFYSPIKEKNSSIGKSERIRRKIAYVPQLTIYTPEEQELLRSNIQANASDSLDFTSLQQDSSIFPVFDENATGAMATSTEKREHLYKILVIGELGTGKTSFIKRYVHQFFSQNYRATIGVDFALKVLYWDQNTVIRLQLWDIAGQERFGNMTRVYYKEAVGAFIVFDVTRSATFDAVIKWKQDLDSKVQLPDGSPIPCILLANKCDQQKQGLVTMPAKMDEYCKENGFAGWFETSAKDNVNIEESAKALVSKILINDKLIHNDIGDDRLVLNADDANKPKKFCSC